jgi:DNA-binding SARP family transcriptional activator
VTDGARDVTPPPGRPSLLVKLVAARTTMTNDEVIDILWPDADLAAGRARLRNLLNRLRTNCRDVVTRRGQSLVLAAGVEVDASRFEALAAAAMSARPAERVGLSRHALSLYPGELLPGDRYEDWVIAIRERLRRRYLALADLVADDAIERGDLDDAIHLLDAAIAAEPMDESRYVKAASALIRQGRRGTARDLVDRAVRLADDLGLRLGVELLGLRDELSMTGRS